MDGVEVLRRVRDDPQDMATCRELGSAEYVVKLVRPDRFQESMDRLVMSIQQVLS